MEVTQTTFDAIGTQWDIRVYEPMSDDTWLQLLIRIHDRIDTFDKSYSRFRSDSLVTQLSQRAGKYGLPADGFKLLHFYEQLYRATNGKVTPLIGQMVSDAGYDASYSLESKVLQRPPSWEKVLTYDEGSITVKQPVLLDFGAAGKGYLVDIIGRLMEQGGVKSYLINAGGDILHRSASDETLEVGLENPLDTSEAIGTVMLANQSLCASAGSKRTWGDYHHILDPTTLRSPDRVLATWVMADDTMTADGLATALFFTEADDLQKQFSFSYALLDKNGGLHYAPSFPVTIFEAA